MHVILHIDIYILPTAHCLSHIAYCLLSVPVRNHLIEKHFPTLQAKLRYIAGHLLQLGDAL